MCDVGRHDRVLLSVSRFQWMDDCVSTTAEGGRVWMGLNALSAAFCQAMDDSGIFQEVAKRSILLRSYYTRATSRVRYSVIRVIAQNRSSLQRPVCSHSSRPRREPCLTPSVHPKHRAMLLPRLPSRSTPIRCIPKPDAFA
jgi:hypothetical protein